MPPESRGSRSIQRPRQKLSGGSSSDDRANDPPEPPTINLRDRSQNGSNEATPVRPRFAIGQEEEDDTKENGKQEAEDQDSLDDDEFESHYSRQDSPVSSDEDENEEDDEDEDEDVVEMSPTRSRLTENGGMIQRVSSLPSSAPNATLRAHLHVSHSTTSLPRAAPPIPPPLYPPFYNRPPTPLPPSPSLTSLLRPPSLLNRSATSTRPTTPDSSDVETQATNDDTEAAVASSARRAHPLPPTAPKVPTYEYYGFVLYLASTLAFFLYLMWAYLPSPFLHAMGITYYPNRWWALAVPAWIVMLLVYIYVALACWNTEYLTLGLQKIETMVDEAGNVAVIDDNGRLRKGGSKRFTSDMEGKRRREKSAVVPLKKRNHHHGNGKKKERKKKDRDKDRDDDDWMFGYTGHIVDGRLANGLTWLQIWNEGTDGVMDVPIGGVCEVLYGQEEPTDF